MQRLVDVWLMPRLPAGHINPIPLTAHYQLEGPLSVAKTESMAFQVIEECLRELIKANPNQETSRYYNGIPLGGFPAHLEFVLSKTSPFHGRVPDYIRDKSSAILGM
jgi:hypothetical protein